MAAIAGLFFFFNRQSSEPEPELSDSGPPEFTIANAGEAFFPADNLSAARRAPIPAALFFHPGLIELGDGYAINPRDASVSYSFNSIDPEGRERFTRLELTNGQGYVINTSYVTDGNLIRTRVYVDPNNGLTLDRTNLTDNPCFDEAIRDQNHEAFRVCLGEVSDGNGGTIGGGRGFSFPGQRPNDVTDLGQVDLNDFAQGILPEQCSADSGPGPVVDDTPTPTPTPTPSPSVSPTATPTQAPRAARAPSSRETGRIGSATIRVRDTAANQEGGPDQAVIDAAKDVMQDMIEIEVARSTGDAQALEDASSSWENAVENLRDAINQSDNKEDYEDELPNLRTSSGTSEPVSPDGGIGNLGVGSPACVAGNNGPGILWQNDAICGERDALQCLAAVNDPVQIITEGKCATVPGPNDQPMLLCAGRNGEAVGRGPPNPDENDDGCNDSDSLCWTDPNTGPGVSGGSGLVNVPNYIDLLGIGHILVGFCSVGGCEQTLGQAGLAPQ
ncbi:MAG: hypothetical protein QNJ15_13805 [Erythrobacter sp.]|nr:hypothetical protein [Erythrobacter sp.]